MGSPTTPEPNIPIQFNSPTANYTNIESLPYLAWWKNFNDPMLNQLIESGLRDNLDISIALSNLEQAQGQLKQIELSWIPFINLYAGYSSNPAFGNIGTFYGAWPQYTLNIAKLIKQQQQAKYNVEITRAMIDGVRLTLIGQISIAYFSLIAEQEQLKLLQQLDNDLVELISLNKNEIKIGLKDNIDIAKFIVNEKQVLAQINQVQHNIVLSQNSLHYLLNQNPGSIKGSNNFAMLNFSTFKPGNLPSTVLQNRPDLLIAKNKLGSSFAGVGVAYASLFPSIQLDSFFGSSSGNGTIGTPSTYTPMNDSYLNWGINPSTFGQIEAGKGAYQANVYQYIQTVRKILKDVDNSFSANLEFSKSYSNTYQACLAQNNKFKLQQGLYKTGIMSYPDLLLNKVDLDNLALSLNQSKLQQALSVVSLYQELAGGYKYSEESSVVK